jgi:nitrite reductase/ring-hydroxylating ferredoxin subunit
VYVAYASLIVHVTFGVLQAETHPLFAVATGVGLATVLALHNAATGKERRLDRDCGEGTHSSETEIRNQKSEIEPDGFVDACAVADIPEKRARIVCLSGERVAIFKYDGKVSAVSNVCQHQNGPLGEGKILDGCITCPWHGYQYLPDTGASPPPFVEKVPTFNVRVRSGRVLVHPRPSPPGVRAESALVAADVPSAVEPGVPPGGNGVQTAGEIESARPYPGGKMPPSTAGETPAATPAR